MAPALILLALAPAPLGAQAATTPAALRGTWAHEAAACRDPKSDGRVAIREKGIEFFASDCALTRVRNAGKSVWLGDFRCQESGQFQDVTLELHAAAPDRLRLRVNADEPQTLVRCAQNVPVR